MAPLRGVRVLEAGDRIAVGLTGGLLALLGADVAVVVPDAPSRDWKWCNPAAALHRKQAISSAALPAALPAADVVLAATDVAPLPNWPRAAGQIVCDVTAYPATSPRAGMADSDALVSTLAGLSDTTGPADGPPVHPGFPLLEGLAALHAAAGILAALLARRGGGDCKDVAVTLHDCAATSLAPFLPEGRYGNGHPLAAPSNRYPARGGDVAICTATDEQFRRLAAAIQAPALAADARFATLRARLAHRAELDAAIAAWSAPRSVAEVVAAMGRVGLPAAPVLTQAALLADHNLALRGSLESAADPMTGMAVPILARPLRLHASAIADTPTQPTPWQARSGPRAPLLSGLTVVELGGYVAAPLAASRLAALGARVIKLEPPEGDPARAWEAPRGGQGSLFAMLNAGKETMRLDISRPDGMKALRHMLEQADVLVESLRPGTLAALGLDRAQLGRINPHLTTCAISGFGALSAYPHRPALDLVAQAMSGILDRARAGDGTPFRVAAPVCAIAAGLAGVLAVLAGLLRPGGWEADISMQDAGAWLTHWEWNAAPAHARVRTDAAEPA